MARSTSLLLVILFHESLNHAEIGLGSLVLCHLNALSTVLAVHEDNDDDEAHIE